MPAKRLEIPKLLIDDDGSVSSSSFDAAQGRESLILEREKENTAIAAAQKDRGKALSDLEALMVGMQARGFGEALFPVASGDGTFSLTERRGPGSQFGQTRTTTFQNEGEVLDYLTGIVNELDQEVLGGALLTQRGNVPFPAASQPSVADAQNLREQTEGLAATSFAKQKRTASLLGEQADLLRARPFGQRGNRATILTTPQGLEDNDLLGRKVKL